MELMLIVWAVSVLSGIKAFVESYTLLCVLVVLVVYLLSKVQFKRIRGSIINKRTLPRIEEGQSFTVTKDDSLGFDEGLIPAGIYVAKDIYRTSNRLYATHVASSVKYLLDMHKVQLSLMPEPEVVAPPIDPYPTYSKPIKFSGWIAGLLIVLNVLLPSDTTLKYMAGAYLIQSLYQSDVTQAVIPLAREATLNKVKQWSKDSTELELLYEKAIQQAGK